MACQCPRTPRRLGGTAVEVSVAVAEGVGVEEGRLTGVAVGNGVGVDMTEGVVGVAVNMAAIGDGVGDSSEELSGSSTAIAKIDSPGDTALK